MAEAFTMIKGVGALAVFEEQNRSCSIFPSVSRVVSVTLTLKKNFTYERKQLSKCSQKHNAYTEKSASK
jgi:hypothetical protein